MREDNLLCVRKRKFVVTTDSNHGRKVYPNLARQMVLTDVDQLWRADITYIRLREEFVFLAVVLDAYSRRVIGWALDRTLEEELTLSALRMALSRRVVEPGLVHHSDRGSQYASGDYTGLLKENGVQISMSRKGNPWDNAACESFMKTLKYEEVHRNEYRDLAEARSEIGTFLEKVYNRKRLHSVSVTYRRRSSKTSFERLREHRREGAPAFFQAWRYLSADECPFESPGPKYRSPAGFDPGLLQGRTGGSTPYSSSRRVPTGYSSAGCSPALPASASPARPS